MTNRVPGSETGPTRTTAMTWKPTYIRLLGFAACAGLLFGCTSAPLPLPQPTNPQVTISGTSLDRVKKALVTEMSKRKFHVAKENGQTISFEQPASKTALESLSSRAVRGGNPVERITFTIASEKDDIQVSADVVILRKLAAMEGETEINQGSEGQTVQAILDQIASQVGTPKATKKEN
jgi:hypothetical protein